MPELPEVEVVARQLRPLLVGARFSTPIHLHPVVFSAAGSLGANQLRGRVVESIWRRGKLLGIALDGGLSLTVHLRMTGRISVCRSEDPVEEHTHVRLGLDDGREFRFHDMRRFGRVRLLDGPALAREPFLKTLGPEPFEIDAGELAERLASRRGGIKGALLDQKLVAGLGNIYVDEILFEVGVHPLMEADRLKLIEHQGIIEAMRDILESAIVSGGSTIRDYSGVGEREGSYQRRHQVFGRQGEDCVRCGATVRKIKVVGRGTHYCPGCQPRRHRRPRHNKMKARA